MLVGLWFLLLQAILGFFDTVYYHEWRARLPIRCPEVRTELFLHGARNLIYGLLFLILPNFELHGKWAIALLVLIAAEVVITVSDFVVETKVRKHLGGVYLGERVTHALLGIIYGAMVVNILPIIFQWWTQPALIVSSSTLIPFALKLTFPLMALVVMLLGFRDFLCATGNKWAAWPWNQNLKHP